MTRDWAAVSRALHDMAADMPITGPYAGGQLFAFVVAVRQAEALALLFEKQTAPYLTREG